MSQFAVSTITALYVLSTSVVSKNSTKHVYILTTCNAFMFYYLYVAFINVLLCLSYYSPSCIHKTNRPKQNDRSKGCGNLTQKSASISLSNPVRRSSSISATSQSFAKTVIFRTHWVSLFYNIVTMWCL